MKKYIPHTIITVLLVIGAMLAFNQKNVVGQAASWRTNPSFYQASSTAFTLTTTSQRLLATSSPRRVAATIQPVNCTVNSAVFLKASLDVAAANNTGMVVFASSTLQLGDYPNIPAIQGSVQGITGVGTCTVLVTEWRSQF